MEVVQPIRDQAKIDRIATWLMGRNPRDHLLFVIGYTTGLRIGDLLKLRVRDVQGTHIQMKEQKTGKRAMPRVILPHVRTAIREYIEGMDPDTFLFRSRVGNNQPITRGMAYKIFHLAGIANRLPNLGTHTLRKTYGYHLYRRTQNAVMVQEALSHSKAEVTLRYIGIRQDELDAAARRTF